VATTLAEVLRHFGAEYLRTHGLSTPQARAWRAIVACRTPALGGQRLRCGGCGAQQWRWHSCRNRHCPQCQSRQREAWRAARLAELLDVPYAHMVFTLPHELNPLALAHPRWVYDSLLHWQAPRRSQRLLFPVRALSRVFRAKFMQALQDALAAGALPRDPACSAADRAQRALALRRHDWVVYAKTALAGPAAVLDYLSRYTHRTAIGTERLVGIRGSQVLLRVRAVGGGGQRTIGIDGCAFIGRLMQHVLPPGFKRIRHYGVLAPAAKTERLALARALLAMPPQSPRAVEDASAFMRRVAAIEIERCPHCRLGRWQVVETVPADRALLASTPRLACRGPP
jgi:hypothetical protein